METTKRQDDYINYEYSKEMGDIVHEIINNIEEVEDEGEELEEQITQVIEDTLIYDDDLWEVLKNYFRPCDLNINITDAQDILITEIAHIIKTI